MALLPLLERRGIPCRSKFMKYGLIVYKDTENIGDDVQSYVATKYLPRIDYIIDRDNVTSFVPKKIVTISGLL